MLSNVICHGVTPFFYTSTLDGRVIARRERALERLTVPPEREDSQVRSREMRLGQV